MVDKHKQNFIECFRSVGPGRGWETVEEHGFTALKSPLREALGNIVWAAPEPGAVARAKAFFGDHAFTWMLQEGQDGGPLSAAGAEHHETLPDLVFDLDPYTCPGHGRRTRIARADSTLDFPFWAATASEALGLDGEAVRTFFRPIVLAGAVPFLAYQDGLPAATALAFVGSETLGIYAVGTREAYRRMGLGRAVTHACLNLGQELGLHHAVLSSSVMGLPMYRGIGFRTERMVSEFQFPGL
jgi:ribosomal protein S18 acetylase RimI-like enzyme